MRRLLLCALTAASVFGWTCAGNTAEPPDEPAAKKSSGFFNLFGLGRKAEKKEAEPKQEERTIKIDPATLLAREKLEVARRMEVCNRLREIAIQTGDAALEAQADELDRLSAELYRQRVAELATASRGSAHDEQTISRRLPQDGGTRDRLAGAGGRNRASGQRAAIREDD